MDKITSIPLHQMSRMDAITALQQCRAELVDARQRVLDLEGEVRALIECDGHQPPQDVRKAGRVRR